MPGIFYPVDTLVARGVVLNAPVFAGMPGNSRMNHIRTVMIRSTRTIMWFAQPRAHCGCMAIGNKAALHLMVSQPSSALQLCNHRIHNYQGTISQHTATPAALPSLPLCRYHQNHHHHSLSKSAMALLSYTHATVTSIDNNRAAETGTASSFR